MEQSKRTGGLQTVKCTLVRATRLLFAERSQSAGLDRFRFGHGEDSKPHAEPTGDDGCTGVAEEGNARTPLRSTRPSLGLPAHEIRAIGSRRRKASARWMIGALSKSPSLHGGKRFRGCFGRSRGSRHVGLVPREGPSHHVAQNSKGIAVPVEMRGSELGSCARTSFEIIGCRSR
jgi:hypothetical protein